MSGEKQWTTWRGRTDIRTDCLTCGEMPDPNTGAHNQRQWARVHVSNNWGHQVHVETTHTRVYATAATQEPA